MHILKININGNPNIGLFGFANDKFCLLSKDASDDVASKVEKVLKVPVLRINICGTSLIGAFIASAGDNSILVPSIAFENELNFLNKAGIKYHIIKTELTALGNNIVCNSEGCLVNPDFDDGDLRQIERAVLKRIKKATIASVPTIGSAIAITKQGCAVHRDISDKEVEILNKTLHTKKILNGTLNLGNPFIRTGVIANSNGFVVGEQTTGPELQFLDEAFGFIDY